MQDILYIMTTETAGVLFAAFAVMYILIPCLYVACMKKYADYLVVCKFCINTHIATSVSRALIYSFISRYARAGTLFSGVFRPFCVHTSLFVTHLKKQ